MPIWIKYFVFGRDNIEFAVKKFDFTSINFIHKYEEFLKQMKHSQINKVLASLLFESSGTTYLKTYVS